MIADFTPSTNYGPPGEVVTSHPMEALLAAATFWVMMPPLDWGVLNVPRILWYEDRSTIKPVKLQEPVRDLESRARGPPNHKHRVKKGTS